MGDRTVFKRIEKKFILTKTEYNEFLDRIRPFIAEDEYGEYTICNVYYDTDTNDLIRKSLDKPFYKEKLRARSYGTAEDNGKIFVEIKKKYDGVVYKRRIKLRRQQWLEMLKTKDAGCVNKEKMSFTDHQILKEIEYFLKLYDPKPALYLAYDRQAFEARDNKALRITFDFAIRSRTGDIRLTKDDETELFADENTVLMEIKVPGAYPLWLSKALSELKIRDRSFSKYGAIYTKNNS